MMTIMVREGDRSEVGIAEAKAHLSRILERVRAGERVVVSKRGVPVAALVAVDDVPEPRQRPLGLVAFAGSLDGWPQMEDDMRDVTRSRRTAHDRDVPDLS
jgi:prevent-host-death family protein